MEHRSQAQKQIDIKRGGDLVETVKTVLITEKSVRRFMLMQEDYVQLEFSLPSAEHFSVGDYIDDIFGRFVITDEQMPKFNTKTGGYDYSLKFEKDYMAGKQWIHCLIANGQRMESRWSLTDKLETHVQQVADNYNIFANVISENTGGDDGPMRAASNISDGYAISVDAENANEVKYIPYEGVNLIKAMDKIAEAWECEWWITEENTTVDGTTYKHTIHFGKCELDNAYYDFRLGENVESMDVARDQQEYANRLFAYGGTQNIPENYDCSLVLTVTNTESGGKFYDSARKLTPSMIKGIETFGGRNISQPAQPEQGSGIKLLSSVTYLPQDHYNLIGRVTTSLTWDWGQSTRPNNAPTVDANLYINGTLVSDGWLPNGLLNSKNLTGESQIVQERCSIWDCTFQFELPATPDGSGNVSVEVLWTASFGTCTASGTYDILAQGGSATAAKEIEVIIGGARQSAIFNCDFSDGRVIPSRLSTSPAPDVSQQVTIPEEYLDVVNIPYSFWSLNYEVGTLKTLGERRLHLPLDDYPNRYTEIAAAEQSQTVELVVVFDKIFPKLLLVVDEVTTEEKIEDIEHSDGSIERQHWVQYKFTARKENGGDFVFNTRYIMDGNALQAVFQAPDDAQSGNMLSGMTFNVGFDNATQVYTIIRNENYGVKLPNGVLYPQSGDAFFLTGWNPKAMPALDLVSDAEDELATESNKYLWAIREGQFTFTCKVMSQWLFDLCAQRFHVNNEEGDTNPANDEPFFADSAAFYVSNGYTEYALLSAGARVRVWHDALPEVGGSRYKESRVIGFEYKLDMPFDTPTYTIGDTDAYSRLKKIEKELTKL